MKKKIFALFAVPMVLVGLSSCNKTVSEFDSTNGETGTLKLNVTFASTGLTKATAAYTMRPTSTWADVNSLMLIVCNSEDQVVARTEVPVTDLTGYSETGNTGTYYFEDVPVGTGYTVYAITNYTTEATTAWTYGYGGLPASDYSLPSLNATPASLGIDNYTVYNGYYNSYEVPAISGGLFSADGAENLYQVYSAAPNYFVGRATAVSVTAGTDSNVSVELERPVNLVRVKVKLSGVNVDETTNNPKITFATNASSMVLRRVNTVYNFVEDEYTSTSDIPEYNVSFAPGPFTALPLSEAPAGYVSTYYLDATASEDYIWYKDMLAFPPTNYTSNEIAEITSAHGDRYPQQLRVSLYATVVNNVTDYVDSAGQPVVAGTVVSFSADADLESVEDYLNLYSGNVIITLNVELASAGNTGGEPSVGDYSNMNVTVELSDWDYEVETDITI